MPLAKNLPQKLESAVTPSSRESENGRRMQMRWRKIQARRIMGGICSVGKLSSVWIKTNDKTFE